MCDFGAKTLVIKYRDNVTGEGGTENNWNKW